MHNLSQMVMELIQSTRTAVVSRCDYNGRTSNDLDFMSKPAEYSKLEKELATIEKTVKVTRASENERTDDL